MRRQLATLLLATALASTVGAVAAPTASAADKNCSDFPSQKAAQIFFIKAGGPSSDPNGLDADGDGIACESNPAPYYYGTTLPGGGGGGGTPSQPQVTVVSSAVALRVAPNRRIAGERYQIKVSVSPAISRPVTIQKRVSGRWKAFAKATTSPSGTVTKGFRAPRRDLALRAVLTTVTKGSTKYTGASSPARPLRVQQQKVTLDFAKTQVPQGRRTRATIEASPVRKGRTVTLQVRSGNGWRTVERTAVDRRGRAKISVRPALGRYAYRAVAARYHGAVSAKSRSRDLTAVDVTPPPAPTDLVASPGDGTVALSWSRSTPADFSHHEVWMRTDTTDWALLTETTSTSFLAEGLENDTVYWFTVDSVDVHGNVSTRTPEVSATPVAPTEPMGRLVR
ncbi:excalibur calcium-binding domain-containing protein [Nocardioides acrostichi]|uniref:excalibur calcium-binding domain-containing protein n=1 Tax=Nocardioides acrostichi TaxID=2784339 RepID=UPI001A9C73C9|nr:excalibur calcium-binding domain-containing protein [Nocardioides acrostichi]